MNYRSKILIALTTCLFCSTEIFGQTLDTVKWGGTNIITYKELYEYKPCARIDTIINFHGCDYTYEDIEVTYFEVQQNICDSILALTNIDDQRKLFNQYYYRIKAYNEIKPRLRMINKSNLRDTFYSPEILFLVKVDDQLFSFTSRETNYNIKSNSFNKLQLIEQIQNAFKEFRLAEIVIKYTTNVDSNKLTWNNNFDHFRFSIPDRTKEVELKIVNSCRDTLTMNFY